MALLRIPGFETPQSPSRLPEAEALARVAAFVQFLREIPWFEHAGEPLDSQTRLLAVDYLAELGFTDCSPVYVKSWEEAAEACSGLDSESFWAMEEDRLAQEAMDLALNALPPDELNLAFTHLAAELSRIIPARLRKMALSEDLDEQLMDAAFGSAAHHAQACAAVIAAGGTSSGSFESSHPFRYRFTLFSLGHWPIGIVGRSMLIF